MIISVAENVMIRRICRMASMDTYSFLWVSFSFFMWFWLARSIKGRSQVVKIIRGVEI